MSSPNKLVFYVCIFLHLITMGISASDVCINEIMSDNESYLQSKNGEYYDWVELYNKGDNSVNLSGYYLSDDQDNLKKWSFPEITIMSGSHIIIFASGLDKILNDELHTNFKISADGEDLFLSDESGNIIDIFEGIELGENKSYGRVPDGDIFKSKLEIPTPNQKNDVNTRIRCSHQSGYYAEPFDLFLDSEDTIYYTTDGSNPTTNSNLYQDKIYLDFSSTNPNRICEIPTTIQDEYIKEWESPSKEIDKATIVRFSAFRNDKQVSKTYTKTYFIGNDIKNKYSMPVLSLTTNPDNFFDNEIGIYVPGIYFDSTQKRVTGNYFQHGDEWERDLHIEYFDNDGISCFQQDAGVRLHGNYSRLHAQKTLRLYAREEYGDKYFNYQLLPQKNIDTYKRFLLRSSINNPAHPTIIRDVICSEFIKELNFESQDYRPVTVFLNGEYWGIYTIKDRIDERFIEYTKGFDKDSIYLIDVNSFDARWDTSNVYYKLYNFIKNNDISDFENYQYVESQIDIDCFIDYHIAELFLANVDWPGNNLKVWKPKNGSGKWRYIFYDLDKGLSPYETNMLEYATNTDINVTFSNHPESTLIFRKMLTNTSFVKQFLDRYAELLETYFTKERLFSIFYRIRDEYEPEVNRHLDRWNYQEDKEAWNRRLERYFFDFFKLRSCIVADNIKEFFDLDYFAFDCNVSFNESNIKDNLKIFPNPCNSELNVEIASNKNTNILITIYDMQGNEVLRQSENTWKKKSKFTYDLSNLTTGFYTIKIENSDGIAHEKLILYK